MRGNFQPKLGSKRENVIDRFFKNQLEPGAWFPSSVHPPITLTAYIHAESDMFVFLVSFPDMPTQCARVDRQTGEKSVDWSGDSHGRGAIDYAT